MTYLQNTTDLYESSACCMALYDPADLDCLDDLPEADDLDKERSACTDAQSKVPTGAECLMVFEPVYGDALDTINPNELYDLIHMEDEEAYRLLFSIMKGPASQIFYKYGRNLMTFAEWNTMAYEVFDLTVNRYREFEATNLSTFFYSALRNRMRDQWRGHYRKGAMAIGRQMPVETMVAELNCIGQDGCPTIVEHERDVINRITCDEICRVLKKELDALDYQVITMIREGYTKTEIQNILEVPYSRVNTALRRGRSIWVRYENEATQSSRRAAEFLQAV